MNKYTYNKVAKKTTDIEAKASSAKKRIKNAFKGIVMAMVMVFIGICISLYLVTKFNQWSTKNEIIWQMPIILRTPVYIRQVKPVIKKIKVQVTPTPTPDKESMLFEKAYDLVWLRESGRGTNKSGLNGYCIKNNMINEIGYAPHEKYCFKDQVEQKATFMLWLKNRLAHNKMPYCNTVSECILNYSSGSYTLTSL